MAKYWCGEVQECQLCDDTFKDSVMYDARLPRYGQWANVCSKCFSREGCQTGTGFGQQYAKQDDGRWLKTGG